jgi:YHS domain-containing protein
MKRALLASACAVALALPFAVRAQDAEKKPQVPAEVACAVMTDHKVDVKKALAEGKYIDHEYNRYFICCDGCVPAFKKDPAKYSKNASVALASFEMPKELTCAVNPGSKVDVKAATEKGQFADHNGRRYYFCCGNCSAGFKKDPAKFSKSASVPVGQLELPKEVACSVMPSKMVNVKAALAKGAFADYEGKRYLFCCAGCPEAFKKDPAKFSTNASIPSPKVAAPVADAAK